MGRHRSRKADEALLSVAARPVERKLITMAQFLDHLTKDAMPVLIDRLSANLKSVADE